MDQGAGLPDHRPAHVRRRRPPRRRLHHLQHVLDPRRPADPGAGPAAGHGRQPGPAHRLGADRGPRWSASWPRPPASSLGLGAAHGLLAIMRTIGFELPSAPIVFRGRTAAMGLVAGVVVTVAAAVIPARRATQVSPMAAIVGRSADEPGRRRPPGGRRRGRHPRSGWPRSSSACSAGCEPPLLAIGLGVGRHPGRHRHADAPHRQPRGPAAGPAARPHPRRARPPGPGERHAQPPPHRRPPPPPS